MAAAFLCAAPTTSYRGTLHSVAGTLLVSSMCIDLFWLLRNAQPIFHCGEHQCIVVTDNQNCHLSRFLLGNL